MNVTEWQTRWGVSDEALRELRMSLIMETMPDTNTASTPEGTVQAQIRIEAAQKGCVLWRNNVGLAFDDRGNPIRFGLANDSTKMNKRIKSSDLIGVRPVLITQQMVGRTIGQFVAREVKRASWTYKGTAREQAQGKYLELVLSLGGDAAFANGTGTL